MLLLLCLLASALLLWRFMKKTESMPPGPPRGIIRDNETPFQRMGVMFREWNLKYGPVISCYLDRKPVIVLGSMKAVRDLLEKRGNIYSSRPRNIMAQEILSGNMRGIGMPYGPRWRKWKRLLQVGLSNRAALSYRGIQSLESIVLLRDLSTETDRFKHSAHIRRYAASVSLSVAYGIRVESLEDEIVVKNEKIAMYFGKLQIPGVFLVESYPILLNLPKSLQWFRHDADRQRAIESEFYLSYFNRAKDEFQRGVATTTMAKHALEHQAEFDLTDIEVAYALSAPWAAGTGTTTTTLEVFLLAMLLYPDKMRKAQEEIDAVIGYDRLPDFKDEESLPYIQALIKEVTRWRAIAPLGVPHCLIEDNVYEGMFLPKGSTVYANIFAITQDENIFPDPDRFIPERFLDTTGPELIDFTIPFGFGRRSCPGMHLALQSIFINVTRILWAFDILLPVYQDGKKVMPTLNEPGTGFVWHPVPFECVFKPRREEIVETIIAEAERSESDLKVAKA